jgi:hypothetical protein
VAIRHEDPKADMGTDRWRVRPAQISPARGRAGRRGYPAKMPIRAVSSAEIAAIARPVTSVGHGQ